MKTLIRNIRAAAQVASNMLVRDRVPARDEVASDLMRLSSELEQLVARLSNAEKQRDKKLEVLNTGVSDAADFLSSYAYSADGLISGPSAAEHHKMVLTLVTARSTVADLRNEVRFTRVKSGNAEPEEK